MSHHVKESLITIQAKGTGKEPFFRAYSRGRCPRFGHVREYLPGRVIRARLSCERKDGRVAARGAAQFPAQEERVGGPLLEGAECISGTGSRSAEPGLQSEGSQRAGPGLLYRASVGTECSLVT